MASSKSLRLLPDSPSVAVALSHHAGNPKGVDIERIDTTRYDTLLSQLSEQEKERSTRMLHELLSSPEFADWQAELTVAPTLKADGRFTRFL